jgi:hypothetical protein
MNLSITIRLEISLTAALLLGKFFFYLQTIYWPL